MTNPYRFIGIERLPDGRLRTAKVDRETLPSLLRARTALAFLHKHDRLEAVEDVELHARHRMCIYSPIDFPDEKLDAQVEIYLTELSKANKNVVGGLLIHQDITAGWTDQAFTMVLHEDLEVGQMQPSFIPSMQWLNDHSGVRRILTGLFLPETTNAA